jgi:hypothetical protein
MRALQHWRNYYLSPKQPSKIFYNHTLKPIIMKKTLLTIAIAICSYYSYAQSYLPLTGGTLTGGLLFDTTDGTYIQLRTGSNPTGFLSNTYNTSGSGSKNDFLSYVYGNNPYSIWTNSQNRLTIDGSGNVGIGTTSPASFLPPSLTSGTSGTYTQVTAIANTPSGLFIRSANNGVGLDLTSDNANGILYIDSRWNNDASSLIFRTKTVGTPVNAMTILGNGNISIGTTDPQGYKLAVNGSAIAESVTVKLHGSWPDFVFKPKYNLLSLTEVKAYIDKNQHLPEMPSEQEVAKNGINLGEIVKLQTKKIEELTLYAIDQQKQIEQLKQEQQKSKQQEACIAALETALLKQTSNK